MKDSPIPPRPVRPGTLAVRRDWTREKGHRWAIVTDKPLHPSNQLTGYLRGYGESHAGLYAYGFLTRTGALTAARSIMASQYLVGSFVWGAE